MVAALWPEAESRFHLFFDGKQKEPATPQPPECAAENAGQIAEINQRVRGDQQIVAAAVPLKEIFEVGNQQIGVNLSCPRPFDATWRQINAIEPLRDIPECRGRQPRPADEITNNEIWQVAH